MALPVAFAQRGLIELSGRQARQLGGEVDREWALVVGEMVAAESDEFGLDLRRVTQDLGLDTGLLAKTAMFGADWLGGPFLANVLAKRAEKLIDGALGQVGDAFAAKVAGAP